MTVDFGIYSRIDLVLHLVQKELHTPLHGTKYGIHERKAGLP